jgi:hypothetical protein
MPLAVDPQNPLLAVSVMTGLALVVAFVTFRWLSSSGRAKTQLGELGGAAAGFVVTFGVLAGIVDYVFRWFGKKFLMTEQQEAAGILSPGQSAPSAERRPLLQKP